MPRSEKEKLVDAVADFNDKIRSAGHKGLKVYYEGVVNLFKDQSSPQERPVFKLTCKKDGAMMGAPTKKLSNIFVEVTPVSMHAAHSDADFMSGSQFDQIQTQEFSYEEMLADHLRDIAGVEIKIP